MNVPVDGGGVDVPVDGGATTIMNNSENSVNFVIKGDANENHVTISDNTYGDTTIVPVS